MSLSLETLGLHIKEGVCARVAVHCRWMVICSSRRVLQIIIDCRVHGLVVLTIQFFMGSDLTPFLFFCNIGLVGIVISATEARRAVSMVLHGIVSIDRVLATVRCSLMLLFSEFFRITKGTRSVYLSFFHRLPF